MIPPISIYFYNEHWYDYIRPINLDINLLHTVSTIPEETETDELPDRPRKSVAGNDIYERNRMNEYRSQGQEERRLEQSLERTVLEKSQKSQSTTTKFNATLDGNGKMYSYSVECVEYCLE